MQAIKDFKNPLGRVAFNVGGTDPKPISKIVPGMFQTEVQPEPKKMGWQQPIVSWTKKAVPSIQAGDVYSSA